MSSSRSGFGSSYFFNSESDIFELPPDGRVSGIPPTIAYIGEIDLEETKYNRYLSPASKLVVPPNGAKLFSGFPRSYIMGGGAEIMFDDIIALIERMEDDGVDITTDFPPDAVHAYPIFRWHEPERTESFIKCATWLDEHWATTVVAEHPREPVEDTLL